MLNRAHAYKAAVDRNLAENEDPDAGVTAGLFMYPVLMAADILMFRAHQVPVGRDQVQHIEMARDFGARFNHFYGEPAGKQYFVLPEAAVDESVATLPGLDGRKMSKSYDNTIPLFAPLADLRKAILAIKTDSRAPGEAKDCEGSALFQLYQAFSTPEETVAMRHAFADGVAWGDAKQALFECVKREVEPMREKYQALIAKPIEIEATLREGAAKARKIATPFMAELRSAVGLRALHMASTREPPAGAKMALPVFKQYREADGKFYFKLLDADGGLLLQGRGFDSPRDAGASIAALKSGDSLGEAGELVEGVEFLRVEAALRALRQADEAKG